MKNCSINFNIINNKKIIIKSSSDLSTNKENLSWDFQNYFFALNKTDVIFGKLNLFLKKCGTKLEWKLDWTMGKFRNMAMFDLIPLI